MELGGLEPPTSWVRSRRSPASNPALCRHFPICRGSKRGRQFRANSARLGRDRAKGATLWPDLCLAESTRHLNATSYCTGAAPRAQRACLRVSRLVQGVASKALLARCAEIASIWLHAGAGRSSGATSLAGRPTRMARGESGVNEGRETTRDLAAPYLCRARASSAGSGLTGHERTGGACARLVVRVVCARAPSLTSVHDPVWLRAGDMMVDGVIPLGQALRPLGLSGPSTRAWRQERAGSRPRRIGVSEGCARMTDFTRVAAPPRRARAGCGSCA
jgi:hypothetical protein